MGEQTNSNTQHWNKIILQFHAYQEQLNPNHYNNFYGHNLIFNTHLFPDVLEDFNTFSDLFKASVYLTCTNKIVNPWKQVQPTRSKVEENGDLHQTS